MIDVEQEIAEALASDIQKQIDTEILIELLIAAGWTKISLERFENNEHSVNIKLWLEDNIKGKYNNNGRTFVFSEESDAVLFILKWG